MRKTDNYKLVLYELDDKMSITASQDSLNATMKIIDSVLKEKATIDDMTNYIEEHKDELKGADGVDGKDGYTPVKGVDYFDGQDGYTPIKGVDYFDGQDGVDGKDYVLTETDKEDISKLVEVNVPSKVSQLENDKNYITSIPSEYITETELNNKGYLTEHQDISHLATKDELNKKANTSHTHSEYLTSIPSEYITETELNNKGYLTQHQDLSNYAKTTDIPTKVSELTNDKGFITSVPSEYVTETEMENFYTEHKDELKGATGATGNPGKDGVGISSVTQTTTSTVDGGTNVITVTKTDGTTSTFSVKNGSKGSTGAKGADGKTPIKGTDYFTDTDKAEMVEGVKNSLENIPDYWKSHLDSKVEDIHRAMEVAGRNKSAFFFYSDAHWDNDNTDTVKMAPTLLKYLYKKTPINKTNFGGDIVHGTGSTDTTAMKYLWEWREQLRDLPNHHSVIGNHDDGNGEMNRKLSKDYVYSFLFAPEETNDIVWGDGFYYYIDDKSEKTRYLYLDIFYDWVSTTQQNFVKEAIKTVEENWHIVAICHAWFAVSYDTYPPVITGLATELQPILNMFDNYNARKDEFSDCGGKVELCIGGHYHLDNYDRTEGGIPVVIVEADTFHNRSGKWPQRNTIEESSVNAVVCDYNSQKIKIIRIGRGDSYEIDMQSGSTTTYYSITNNFTNVTSSSQLTQVEANEPYTTTLTPTVGEFNTVKVTMGGTDITSSAYNSSTGVINIAKVTGNIIITAMAESTKPAYTNVLETVGYTVNKRFGSDGTERDNTGSTVTGWIEAKAGDYIYFKNVDMKVDASNYGNGIFHYDTNKAKIIGYYLNSISASLYTVDSTNNLVKLKVNTDYSTTAYMRFSATKIDETSIITVNEPIE